MLLVANLTNTKWCKTLKNDRYPATWVLIWDQYPMHIQCIPTWHGLDAFQKSLHLCALDENTPSNGGLSTVPAIQVISVLKPLFLFELR